MVRVSRVEPGSVAATLGIVPGMQLRAVNGRDLARTGIEAHHSYFWPRVEATLASGRTISHDFKIVGVLY